MLIKKIALIACGQWDGRGAWRQGARLGRRYDVQEGGGECAYESGRSRVGEGRDVTQVAESKEREMPGHLEGFCLDCWQCGCLRL